MKIAVIGSGFGGLGAACLLAKAGHQVTVLEKNSQLGGRAGRFAAKGFRFDTGPSWYLMPEAFERFFELLDEKLADHLDLVKLRPGCRLTFADGEQLDITGQLAHDKRSFEALETGAGAQLERYLGTTGQLYHTAMDRVLYKDADRALLSPALLRHFRALGRLDRHVGRYFNDARLRQAVEFPAAFLGTSPYKAPAVYGLLNHAVFTQGIYYPRGGMYEVTEALVSLARRLGVRLQTKTPVEEILVTDGCVSGVRAGRRWHEADAVISNAGVQYTETDLLDNQHRDHSAAYWQRRTLAPSALLIYLGVSRQYGTLQHHNLVFSRNWRQNFADLFDRPVWPEDPSFYVCAPSRTDPTVAPEGCENLFVMVPIAAGLAYTPAELEAYANKILVVMEKKLKLPNLRQQLVYKKLFCVKDFAEQFNSPQGTALGLAHTWRQTAAGRPRNYSRKVQNLYYAGADVHPGIGLPTALISAELAVRQLTALR